MLERIRELGKILKKAGIKMVLLIIFVPTLFCFLAVCFINSYLKVRYENVYYEDRLMVAELSSDFNEYLDEVENFVNAAAEGLEYLVDQDADHEKIHNYLSDEYNALSVRVSDDTDGLYGYINGEYNDGYGWKPYEGYDPTERIWYKTAIAAGNRTVMVEPYIDVRTNDMVVTVARALRNGKDVVAADLNLKEFQSMTESLASGVENHEIMVVDDDGWVIASSHKMLVGKNFKEDENESRRAAFAKWEGGNGEPFVAEIMGTRYLFSQAQIKFGWTAISFCDVNVIFNMLGNLLIMGVIAVVIGAILLIALMAAITKRQIQADEDNESLHAVASIYITIHKIDLTDGTFQQILCDDYMVSESIGDSKTDVARVIKEVMKKVTEKRSLDEVLEFVDLRTIDDRMKGKDTISVEFLNYDHLWHRGRFIAVKRAPDGRLQTILWAVEQIDEEKRYRDKLQYLAETDMLTGINNRGSGERKIRDLIQMGKGGMFILFDVDKFKNINDTYGHDAGDKVLIGIAECMSKNFRDRDIIMRLGGDEFAVYVPYVYNKEEGEPIIERFIIAIENMDIPEIEGKRISISLGVSFYHQEDTFTFEELYRKADSCTYESKKVTGCHATYYSDIEES